MRATWRLLGLVLAVLLPLSALAGCMQSDPEGDGATGDGSDGTDGSDGSSDALTKSEAFTVVDAAFAKMNANEHDLPDRVAAELVVNGRNASSDARFEITVLLDVAEGVLVTTVSGEGFASGDAAMFADGDMITGQAWKTSFIGSRDGLIGTYNASAVPPSSFKDASDDASGTDGATAFFGTFNELVEEDLVEAERITHAGRAAVRAVVHHEEDNATVTGEIIVFEESMLPARIDVNMRDPNAEDEWARDARMTITFRYGEDATHELEDALKRLETMTLLDENATGGGFGFGDQSANTDANGRNYTIQPSHFNAFRAPLDAVEAHAMRQQSGSGSEETEPDLVLPLEEGSVENADVRLTFTDKDEDGKVSTGDLLRVDWLTDDGQQYAVSLFDEESGLRVLPAPGVLAFLGALAAVALALGRVRAGRR